VKERKKEKGGLPVRLLLPFLKIVSILEGKRERGKVCKRVRNRKGGKEKRLTPTSPIVFLLTEKGQEPAEYGRRRKKGGE